MHTTSILWVAGLIQASLQASNEPRGPASFTIPYSYSSTPAWPLNLIETTRFRLWWLGSARAASEKAATFTFHYSEGSILYSQGGVMFLRASLIEHHITLLCTAFHHTNNKFPRTLSSSSTHFPYWPSPIHAVNQSVLHYTSD